ncbi:hypothetical protein C6503_12915 [Candidatus Poribacteria bacterium]|nr:MAG: hypothetical protein C6503_12915 [Candidatus Poribacteria bacterium]
MMETNIRIVEPGIELILLTRCAKIKILAPSAKMIEKVCNQFASRNLAAVYCPQRQQILVLTPNFISQFMVKDDKEDWTVKVVDGGKNQKLQFSHSENDASLLAQLIERHVQIEIKRRLKMQTPDSPRIFQTPKPFDTVEDIDVYRRFEVSALPIQGIGVGISVDISTAFFSHWTVADVFRDDIPDHEQQRLQKDFESLSQRQRGQKGTLLYDLGNKQRKCYFDQFLQGITCATTGTLYVNGQTYNSLFEYYQHNQSHLKINPDDSVAMVSFPRMNQPRPVAAKLLRLRVRNESLPRLLKQVDKIAPKDRRRLISGFWQSLGSNPLERAELSVSQHFWCPEEKQIINLLPPTLQFSDGATLPAPQKRDYREFQEHYRQRLPLLHKVGCLDIPFLMDRIVHFAIPKKARQEMRGYLIRDITENLRQLTKVPITSEALLYDSLDDVFSKIKHHPNPGTVVFVFDEETPEAYYTVSRQLSNWRVKRITLRELTNQFGRLKSTGNHGGNPPLRAERGWKSFIEMITLDVLQQMDCILWDLKDEPAYDAHLAIDVGREGRYFALSLLIFHPSLRIWTVVKPKTDVKKETINGAILGEEIIELCNEVAQRKDFQPLRSLLVLRDGRECGGELEAIYTAKQKLRKRKFFTEEVTVDIVDFHKNIAKNPRLWAKIQRNRIEQAFEGKAVVLDNRKIVLPTTGAPTLRQGTADPVMLVGQNDGVDMVRVTKAVYASTHLNFSNPNVTQKLPLELKRTDDALTSRDSQEIRRIR